METISKTLLEHLKELSALGVNGCPSIAQQTSDVAWSFWRELSVATRGNLKVPMVLPGPDRQVCFTWCHGPHCLEAEIRASGPTVVAYCDSASSVCEDYSLESNTSIPPELTERLGLFARP